jgi:hypothetical protein
MLVPEGCGISSTMANSWLSPLSMVRIAPVCKPNQSNQRLLAPAVAP